LCLSNPSDFKINIVRLLLADSEMNALARYSLRPSLIPCIL